MSIFRRRLMMGEKKPIEYLEFEDRRVWEICAYRWGYTQNIQEVGGAGGVLDEGVIEGNNDTMVYCDHIFAASYAIGAHGSVPATAARTVQYRIELYVNGSQSEAGAPWEIATPATATNPALYIAQYGTTMSATALKNITLESWADASYWESQTDLTYNAEKGCWECLVTVTNACQYLRIGLRAAAGVSVSWKVVSVGVTKVPQGITTAQCAAVSSLGTSFASNTLITMFNELVMFTSLVAISKQHWNGTPGGFYRCSNLLEVTLPPTLNTLGCYAFKFTEKLERINNLENIEWFHYGNNGNMPTFQSCGAFEINLPNLKDPIPGNCFRGAKRLNKVVIGAACNTIGANSFWQGTYNIGIFLATTPPSLGAYNTGLKIIYVPDESVDAYKAATNWSAQASKIHPLSEYVED